jgi:transcriptional regulator with GAF, ATPase, and Fis domain
MWETARDSDVEADDASSAVPGAIVVWTDRTPRLIPQRITGDGLVLGRQPHTEADDDRLSRQHVRLRWTSDQLRIADLGSRNGTYVDGRLIAGEVSACPPAIVRAGRTVVIAVADVRPFEGVSITTDGVVIGPTLRARWTAVETAAQLSKTLLITGESGVGKELAAQAYHRAAGRKGELIAVNCAAIPTGLAERLLFGACKGAYSGADRDVDGYVAAADGGTLFLDEVAELELDVQAKLLRVLERGELMAVGASRSRRVDLRVITATLRDLRAAVARGAFRDDLYYRIGRPEVRIPALRDRLEDIPWLVGAAVQARGLAAHPAFIEACLLRRWPGNVRELVGEVARAADAAALAGRQVVRKEDLDEQAGHAPTQEAEPADAESDPTPTATLPDAVTILEALRAEGGNVSRSARRLGVHRNQLRRYLARNPAALASSGISDDD